MNLDATISKSEGWKRVISVTVPVEEVEAAFATATQQYRQKAKIPGFRPGKAPLEMVNRQYGEQIRQDVLEALIPRAFDAALHKLELRPLGTPELSSIDFDRGKPLAFTAEFEIRPQVEIKDYRGLKLTKRVYDVPDSDIDATLEALRDSAAELIEVHRPAREGDVVICDLHKVYDRLNRVKQSEFNGVKIELHPERTRAELFQNINGMSVGEGKEVEIAYPPDEPQPDLAGNTVLYRIWLKQVMQKQLAPVDDELAKKVTGGKIETVPALREAIRQDIAARAENAAQRDLRGQIRKLAVEANPVEVPAGFLKEHIEEVTERLRARDQSAQPETIRAQFEPMAIEQFRWDYLVSELARKEGIEVSDAEVEMVLKSWPAQGREKPDPDKVHWNMLEMKVYDWLLANAQVSEEKYVPPGASRIVTP
jgi:trigger factor